MKSVFCKIFLLFLLLVICHPQIISSKSINQSSNGTSLPPTWTKTYPAVTKGLTSVYFKVRLNQQATVYYAFYQSEVQNITAQKIKDDATASQNSNAFKSGTIAYPGATSTGSLLVEGFEKDKTYYFYLAAESENNLMEDNEIKNYTITLTLKNKVIPKDSTTSPYGYLEYLPKGYNSSADNLFPLILFMHGAGGTGEGSYSSLTSNTGLLREGIIRYIELEFDLPAVILSPQTFGWSAKTINDFVEFAQHKYNIDTNRIYVTGISLGGGGTWSYISQYPEKVAAAMPLCGANSPSNFENLVNVPIWAFHNDKDPTVPLSTTTNAINNIIDAGGNPLLSVFESDDHSVAYDAYHFPGVWDWLFAQKKTSGINNIGIANVFNTNQRPIIDGNLNDNCWYLNQIDIENYKIILDTYSTYFKLVWDKNNLYIGVKLFTTDFMKADRYIVTVYINGNNNNDTAYDAFDKAITFVNINNTIEGKGNLEGIEHAWAQNSDTVTLEISIPFKNNFCPNPFAGSGFGFDLYSENYTEKDWACWNGDSYNSVSTKNLGHILLSSKKTIYDMQTSVKYNNPDVGNILNPCYPNPFSNNTIISYNIQETTECIIKILDYTGHEVVVYKTEENNPGIYSLNFNGKQLKAGVYFVYLTTNEGVFCQKIIKQ